MTIWIDRLKAGDPEAARTLWDIYFPRLVPLAHKYLDNRSRRVGDGEDVVVSVFKSFCARAAQGKYTQLHDRDGLWSLLAAITVHKAIDARRREARQVRGAGKVLAEEELGGSSDSSSGMERVIDGEPGPETAALVADQLRWLLGRLGDDTLQAVTVLRLQGYSVAEIARKLGRVPRSIERKLERIRSIWNREFR